jgi:glycosyltransferase involved in cell wall biosynthesis
VPEHREVLDDAGLYFSTRDASTLARQLEFVLSHPDAVLKYRELARNRVAAEYSWEHVTDLYETLFRKLARISPQPAAERMDCA